MLKQEPWGSKSLSYDLPEDLRKLGVTVSPQGGLWRSESILSGSQEAEKNTHNI